MIAFYNIKERQFITDFKTISTKEEIEALLDNDLSILGKNLLLVGKNIIISNTKQIDILAIDIKANLYIIQLATNNTFKSVLFSTLDTAADVQKLTYYEVNLVSEKFHNKPIETLFFEHFKTQLPPNINQKQEIIVIQTVKDEEDNKMLNYLIQRIGVPINAVLFQRLNNAESQMIIQHWHSSPFVEELKTDDGQAHINIVIEKKETKPVDTDNRKVVNTNITNKPEVEAHITEPQKTNSPEVTHKPAETIRKDYSDNINKELKTNIFKGSIYEEYELGIPEIDDQHKFLLDTFDEYIESFEKNEQDDKIATIIDKLELYGNFHFETEEKIMDSIDKEMFESHKKQHIFFIKSVADFKAQHNYGNKTLANTLVVFLKKWFLAHIKTSDVILRNEILKYNSNL